MLFASIILKETLNLSSKSLVTFKCLLKWWAWTLDALTAASGESVVKVSAAPAVGEEMVGEITMPPDKKAGTVAVTGGDYDISAQTIIGPDFQTCGACEALVFNSAGKGESVALVLDSVGKEESDIESVICSQS